MQIYFIGDDGLFEDKDVQHATIDEAYEYLVSQKVVSIDIETTRKFNGKYGDREGLSPYLSKIVMLQIGTLERQYIIDTRVYDIGKIRYILSSDSILKVGHNLKFEYNHIYHNYGVKLVNLYDTMLVEQIIYCGLDDYEFNLKALIERYFNRAVNKTVRLEFLKIHNKPFSYIQLRYGAEDIIYPLKIRELQLGKIHTQDLNNVVHLEHLFLPVLAEVEYKGMHFDKDKWETIYNKNKPILNSLKLQLDNFIVTYFPNSPFISNQTDLFNPLPQCNILWSSSKQVIDLFRFLNACPLEMSKQTGKMAYTVNAKVLMSSLNTINKNQPSHIKSFIKLYVEYKEYEQRCTTFGLDFFKYINPITKRVHSDFKQILNTGRMSSRDPNLQNIPSDEEYRKCFTAPEGYKIVNADYSGQETVVMANLSQEKNMINLIENKGDMHCFVTKAINPEIANLSDDEIKKHHKDKRQVAKAAGFAINYGGNGYTIAQNLGIPVEDGDRVYEAYFKAFPDLKKYFVKVQNITLRQGYVLIDSITGRKSYFKRPMDSKQEHAIKKKALNYPVQGLSGSMTKYASILFRRWILENNLENEVFITNIVHDEINLECTLDYTTSAANALEHAMKTAADMWCKLVKMNASAVITDHWGH